MKRKSIVVLLVLLLVGILAFTAFACNNNKDKDDDDKKPPVEEKPDDETPGYLSEALTSVVSGADSLIRELAAIEDEAYISAGLEFGVIVGEGEEQFELDVALNLKASISENTTSKNWAFVEIAVGGEEGNNVALFAEAAGENKEIVYLGQSLTDAEYKWSKLSQLDVSELAEGSPIVGSLLTGEGGLISNVYTAITNLNAMEIEDDTFGKGTFGDLASQGFIGNSALSSLISMAGTMASELIPTTKSTVNGDTVYEATLDLTEVSSLLSDLSAGGEGIDLSGFKDIIDAIGPILLGLTYDQITNPDAQVSEDPADYPTITIAITIGEDGALKGLSLHRIPRLWHWISRSPISLFPPPPKRSKDPKALKMPKNLRRTSLSTPPFPPLTAHRRARPSTFTSTPPSNSAGTRTAMSPSTSATSKDTPRSLIREVAALSFRT